MENEAETEPQESALSDTEQDDIDNEMFSLQDLGLNMSQIMHGLYISDFMSSQQFPILRELGIRHIIAVMRQKYTAPADFSLHRVPVDDNDRTNMMAHFETCNDIIRTALLKDEGVLVHCQAGVSRSTTVCAAFLMHEFGLTVDEAMERISAVRSAVAPTEFFLAQLEMYERMNYEVDPVKYAEYRRFLMNFNHVDIMGGDGSVNQLYLAYYPSPAPTPRDRAVSDPFRSLRMTPVEGSLSRRSSNASVKSLLSRRSSSTSIRRPSRSDFAMTSMTPTESSSGAEPTSATMTRPRKGSGRFGSELGMTPVSNSPPRPPIERQSSSSSSINAASSAAVSGSAALREDIRRMLRSHSDGKSAADLEAERRAREKELASTEAKLVIEGKEKLLSVGKGRFVVKGRRLRCKMCRRELAAREHIVVHEPGEGQAAFAPRRRDMAQHRRDVETRKAEALQKEQAKAYGAQKSAPLPAATSTGLEEVETSKDEAATAEPAGLPVPAGPDSDLQPLIAQEFSADPAPMRAAPLAQRRGQDLKLTIPTGSAMGRPADDYAVEDESPAAASPPLLHSSSCSSYFVEPLSWMSEQLSDGQLGGKIVCPNQKCASKLGSFDWSGLQCSCGAWIVPAFQLLASKVDEV